MSLLSHKRKKSYPSDLTDKEWVLLAPLLPVSWKNGRPPRHEMREIVDAIRYFLRTGCQWRYLPAEFPPWKDRLLVVEQVEQGGSLGAGS